MPVTRVSGPHAYTRCTQNKPGESLAFASARFSLSHTNNLEVRPLVFLPQPPTFQFPFYSHSLMLRRFLFFAKLLCTSFLLSLTHTPMFPIFHVHTVTLTFPSPRPPPHPKHFPKKKCKELIVDIRIGEVVFFIASCQRHLVSERAAPELTVND